MALNLISSHLMLVFGVVRPGYLTYMDFNRDGPEQCTKWIKYWIVYAFATSILSVTDLLFFWLPCYDIGKLISIVYLTIAAPRNGIRMYNFLFCYLLENHKNIFNKCPFLNSKIKEFFNAEPETETNNELCLYEEEEKDTDKDKKKDKFYFKKVHNGRNVIFNISGTKKYIRSQIKSNWKFKKIPAATESVKAISSKDEVEVEC